MKTTLKLLAATALLTVPTAALAGDASVVAIVTHPVEDYAAWRAVYDGFEDVQKTGGVLEEAVFRDAEDPNKVTILHYFGSMDEATAFFSSKDLKKAMTDAGVSGPPSISFATTTD